MHNPVARLPERYWSWLKATQAQYVVGYAPLWVSASVVLALACLTVPAGLLLGLLGGYGGAGVEAGLVLAVPLSLPVAAYAKHRGRREHGEDVWKPTR